jgi:hypothetical protein
VRLQQRPQKTSGLHLQLQLRLLLLRAAAGCC